MSGIKNIFALLRILSVVSWCYPKKNGSGSGIIDKILSIIQVLTGETDETAIEEKLRNSPILLAQVKSAIAREVSVIERIHQDDRLNARAHDLAIREKALPSNRRANFMLFFAILGLASCLFIVWVMRERLSGEMICILSTLCGIFGSYLQDIYMFEFGSRRHIPVSKLRI